MAGYLAEREQPAMEPVGSKMWIVSIQAPNGLEYHYRVDPMMIDLARDPVNLLIGSDELREQVAHMVERRDEVNPNAN